MRVLHIIPWQFEELTNGGTRRSAQLAEWLAESPGLLVERWYARTHPELSIPFISKLIWNAIRYFSVKRFYSLRGFLKFLSGSALLQNVINDVRPDIIFVELAPPYAMVLGHALTLMHTDYIAATHNIEALVPGQNLKDFRSRGALLDVEAAIGTRARCVITISELDDGVMKTMGARTQLLPYFPVRRELERFRRVNKARASGKTDAFLVLGSATNEPTRIAMAKTIAALSTCLAGSNISVKVAGYGTESLFHLSSDRIKVIGSVSDGDLDLLLASARAAVLWQPFTSGGLTRLVELNLCGVRTYLFGSYIQARGNEAYGILAIPGNIDPTSFQPSESERSGAARFKRPTISFATVVRNFGPTQRN